MSHYSGLAAALSSFVGMIPAFVVWVVGAVLCIANWRRHQSACALALAGIAFLMVRMAISISFSFVMTNMVAQGGATAIARTMLPRMATDSVLSAVAYGLLIAAVFAGRGDSPSA